MLTSRACMVGIVLAGAAFAQQSESPMAVLMRSLGDTVAALTRALEHEDRAAAAEQAAALETRAAGVLAFEPPRNAEHRADVAFHVASVRRESLAIVAAAGQKDLAAQRAGLDSIRRTCVACHLEFRSGLEGRSLWPDESNAIYGRIRLRQEDGGPRPDAGHVVVFLDGASTPAKPGARAQIAQRDKTFVPDLLAVTVGTRVEFPNRDAVFHNVFSKSKQEPFDLGLYGQGETQSHVFAKPGLVKIYCNIHPEMVAHVLVLPNPHSVITTPTGFFALSDVPDGTHRLRTWSEFGAEIERNVAVGGRSSVEVDLELKETKRRAPHLNKHGLPYREKY